MREITRKRIPYSKEDLKQLVKSAPLKKDYDEVISDSFLLRDEDSGEVKMIFKVLSDDALETIRTLRRIRYDKGKRLRGLVSQSRIIGYRPRLTIRQDFCSSTALATEQPAEHKQICDLVKEGDKIYQEAAPDVYAGHKKLVEEKILPDYRIEDTLYTSGIINRDNPLKYHFDTGNFNNVFSCMFTYRYGIEGGYLSVPEYGIAIETVNNSVLLFDGQGLVHGVTPIRKVKDNAFRFSVVFYTLKNISKCLPPEEELKRIRNKKTEREKIRHNMPKEHREMLEKAKGKQ